MEQIRPTWKITFAVATCFLIFMALNVLKPSGVRAMGPLGQYSPLFPYSSWSSVASPVSFTSNLSSFTFNCPPPNYCSSRALGASFTSFDNTKAAFGVTVTDPDGTSQSFQDRIMSPNGFATGTTGSSLVPNVFNWTCATEYFVPPGGNLTVNVETPNSNPSGAVLGGSVNGVRMLSVGLRYNLP